MLRADLRYAQKLQAKGGHGGPPLHLRQGYQLTLGVNVGAALRGRPSRIIPSEVSVSG